MGIAANELATGFGWARMAAQYIALYRQLAGQQEDRQRAGKITATETEALGANVLTGRTGIEYKGIEFKGVEYQTADCKVAE
jgi:hypothetical protein